MVQGTDEPKKGGGCLDGAAAAVFTGLEKFYQRVGFAIGTRPYAFMLAALVLLLACSAGFRRFEQETRGEKLWVPGGTEAQKDKEIVEANFVKFARFEEFILLSDPPGENVLTPDVLDYIYSIHQEVTALQVENPLGDEEGEKRNISYNTEGKDVEPLCYKRGPACFQINIIEVFGGDPQAWSTEEKILAKLNSEELTAKNGERIEVLSLLGGIERNQNGDIISAVSVATNYFLNNNEEESSSEGYEDKKGEAWEQLFLDLLEEETKAAQKQGLRLDRFAIRSFADEFGGGIQGDLIKLNIAICMLLAYSIAMISRWSEGCVGSRVMLAVGGFISIGLALFAALGLGSAFGLFYSPLMGVFPFLLIGIGVDDMFVMVSAYDRTPTDLTVAERLSIALGRSGASITVTSITDFCAFLIGSNTTLPALRAFSIFAALGILLTLFFQVLFFAGWLVYDEKLRRDNGRLDIFCCFKAPQGEKCGCGSDSLLEKAMEKLGVALGYTWSKVSVLIIFGLLTAAGVYGLTQISVDADVDDFIPAGSYLADWNEVKENYYKSIGAGVGIYMHNVDFASPQVQGQLTDMYNELKNNPNVAPATAKSWYEEFKASEGVDVIPPEEFYSTLSAWLQKNPNNGGGSNFISDIQMSKNGDGINACRFTANHLQTQKSQTLVKQMDSMRSTVSQFPAPLGPNSFAYGEGYVQNEQYKAIGREALTNIGLALLMVFVVVFLLLVNPLGAGITFVCIALVVVELVGFMHFWKISIDNVVVIFTVIALGLSVDYAVHIAHAYLAASGTPNERIVKSLTELGPAVIHGALSTFMAVLVLSLSISYVFTIFFRALFLCVVLGLAHGLILLPVAMSLLAPSSTLKSACDAPPCDVELTKSDNEAKPLP